MKKSTILKSALSVILITMLAIPSSILATSEETSQKDPVSGGPGGSHMYKYAPTISSDGGDHETYIEVNENQTFVTNVTAMAIVPEGLTYLIAGGSDQNLFMIDPKIGKLTFKTAPDYEKPIDTNKDNIYLVQVRVENQGHASNPFDLQDIFVKVLDINETENITSIVNTNTTQTPTTSRDIGGPESCSPYLLSYIRYGANNKVEDVIKLKSFLNEFEGENLDISNGTYDKASYDAVIRFQEKYTHDVLKPWGITKGTGYVYITTTKKINEMSCGK